MDKNSQSFYSAKLSWQKIDESEHLKLKNNWLKMLVDLFRKQKKQDVYLIINLPINLFLPMKKQKHREIYYLICHRGGVST